GKAEHDALVAGPLVLVARSVDALGDVSRLLMHMAGKIESLPVETLLLVADALDHAARQLFHATGVDGSGAAHFAGEDNAVGGRQRFHGDAGIGILGKERIDAGVRYLIADLVGMTL